MPTLEFGTPTKTAEDFIAEIQDLLGCNPPISLSVSNGQLRQLSVETEWKEGYTTPVEGEVEVEKTIFVDDFREELVEVELVDDNTGQPLKLEDGSPAKQSQVVQVPFQRQELIRTKEMRVVGYAETYENKSLDSEQINKLNQYLQENIEQ